MMGKPPVTTSEPRIFLLSPANLGGERAALLAERCADLAKSDDAPRPIRDAADRAAAIAATLGGRLATIAMES